MGFYSMFNVQNNTKSSVGDFFVQQVLVCEAEGEIFNIRPVVEDLVHLMRGLPLMVSKLVPELLFHNLCKKYL